MKLLKQAEIPLRFFFAPLCGASPPKDGSASFVAEKKSLPVRQAGVSSQRILIGRHLAEVPAASLGEAKRQGRRRIE